LSLPVFDLHSALFCHVFSLNATTPSEFASYWLFETTSTARAAGINNITGP
jgi:hypothetical protein